ncbi:MAG: PAS domain S-box protein [Deltaproteobacteria bacterium]|nr:PAS domain S-box protein [Deltaproteobacteria bacterium]
MDKSPQILIAADDQFLAREARNVLNLGGYTVPAVVSSGEDAVRQAEVLSLDLVLMDPALKGKMSGVEAAGLIRFFFDIPVVYIIADKSGSGLEEVECAHSFGCVFAPFRDAELRAAMKIALSRHEVEKGLRESEERYRTIIEGMEDGYYEVDLAGRFTFFNRGICRLTDIPENELMGVSSRDYTTPETAKKLYETFNEIYRTGRSAAVEDYEIVRKDGSRRIIEFNASLIKDRKGRPVGFRGVARDVTERRLVEAALRESEEKYRRILEEIEDGYWEIDLSGRFTFFNDALPRMAGIPPEQLMGMGNREYTSPETAKRIYAIFNRVYRTGKPANIVDHEFLRPDGTRGTHELSVSLMRDEQGKPIGFRGISRDVTVRKQAEEEIRTHREHLALINQILRHDLTNDLLVTKSALAMYARSPEGDHLEEASGRVKKSLNLINRMRELESFMSSHRELKAYPIRNVIDEVAGNYPSIRCVIKGRARVMAHESLFSVVDNIIQNAVIHGGADRIDVTIVRRDDVCEVRIADNGSGIPDEIKETIFEEGVIHGDAGHTGLGLHVVRKAMERYGGSVSVHENKPRGAVFALTFKRVE